MPNPEPTPSNVNGRPVLAVGAIVVVEEHLLLVTRANPPGQGLWTVPGGRVEAGERMVDAVAREVAEETGLIVECGQPLGWVERISHAHHFVIVDFRATPVPTVGTRARLAELTPTAGDDAGDARWVALTDLPETDLVPGLLDFLRQHQVVERA